MPGQDRIGDRRTGVRAGQARETFSIRVDRDVPVTMRDGTVLMTDVYRPAAEGRYPVLLQRTPYNKETGGLSLVQTDTFRAVRRGYAVVIQDCRGRYRSDGDFSPFLQEIADGYDAVEWCGSQPWSDGNVGMYGTSYVGATQWLAAIAAPPSLRAIAPAFTASDYYEGWTYQGGAFQWGFMCNWVLPFLTTADLLRSNARQGVPDFDEWRDRLIAAIDNCQRDRQGAAADATSRSTRSGLPTSAEWMAHPSRDEFWQAAQHRGRHDQVRVPGAQHRRLVRHLPRRVAAQLHRRPGSRGRLRRRATGSRFCSAHGRTPLRLSPSQARSISAPWAGQSLMPLSLDVDGRHTALLRLLAEGDRRRLSTTSRRCASSSWARTSGAPRTSGRWRGRSRPSSSCSSGGNANSSAGDGTLAQRSAGR